MEIAVNLKLSPPSRVQTLLHRKARLNPFRCLTMIRTVFLLIPVLACTLLPTLAQSPRDSRSRGGSGQIPQPGTILPTVRTVDEQGRDFSTASLRGSYTVLVFGCLT